MPGIDDVQFQAPRPNPSSPAGGTNIPRTVALIVAGLIVVAAAGYFMYTRRPAPATAPAASTTGAPQTDKALADDAEKIALPPLDDSDALVRQRVGVLSSHPLVSAWLAGTGLIRNFVVVIDNIAHGATPSGHLRVLRPAGQFRVVTRGTQTTIDPRNYARYSGIVGAAASIDPRAASRTYGTFKPLLQMAYDDLGNQEPIDRALERAIVSLLKVPVVDGDVGVRLAGEGIGYEFEDPKLEALTGAQKQLLRMGPDNVKAIQQQLRLFALALGIPASRLPS